MNEPSNNPTPENSARKTIFIVDDEPGFSRMFKIFLEATGNYHVEFETDSTLAIKKARQIKPDAILLDLIMPKMDGAELKAKMDEDPLLKSIPKMFFTSNVIHEDASEGELVKTGDGIMLPKTTPPAVVRDYIDQLVSGEI